MARDKSVLTKAQEERIIEFEQVSGWEVGWDSERNGWLMYNEHGKPHDIFYSFAEIDGFIEDMIEGFRNGN